MVFDDFSHIMPIDFHYNHKSLFKQKGDETRTNFSKHVCTSTLRCLSVETGKARTHFGNPV